LPKGVRFWRNLITGESLEGRRILSADRLFASFPGALLIGAEGKSRPTG